MTKPRQQKKCKLCNKNIAEWNKSGYCSSCNAQVRRDRKKEERRTRCEVFSRVVGYIRPVNTWNDGKTAEFKDRKVFKIENVSG